MVIEHAYDSDRYLEFIDTRRGTRTLITKDLETTDFDSRNRAVKARDALNRVSYLFYKGDAFVPFKIAITGEGTWEREGDRAAGPSDIYRWKETASGQIAERAVFARDGRYSFIASPAAAERSTGDQPGSVEFLHDGGKPSALIKTVKRRDGSTSKFNVVRQTDGTWRDDTGKAYESAWGGEALGRLFLAASNGRAIRRVESDGTESETRYDDRYQLASFVEWNALGEATLVQDARLTVTRFLRDDRGDIEGIMQGENLASRVKGTNEWRISLAPDAPVTASVKIDGSGNQVWTATSGLVRTARADGTVQIQWPAGHRTSIRADGSETTHVFRAGNGVREVVHHANGRVEITFRSGVKWRQESYSNAIHQIDESGQATKDETGRPRVSRGSIAVAKGGVTTLMDDDTRNVAVFFPDGKSTRLDYLSGTGWIDVVSGRLCRNSQELDERLREIGAANPTQPDGAYRMGDANRIDRIGLFRALDELLWEAPK